MAISFPYETESFIVHLIRGCINNIFLIETDNGFFLLDPGLYGDIGEIESYVKKSTGIRIDAIKLSLVSHMHPDHCGGAVALRNRYGIAIAAHRRANLWYGGFRGQIQFLIDWFLTMEVIKRSGAPMRRIRFKMSEAPDFPLDDGNSLPGFSDWICLCVPGHTLHDMAVVHSKTGVIYAGDTVICVRERFDLPMPILFMKAMRQSYERLANTGAKKVLVAHGSPLVKKDCWELFKHMNSLTHKKPSSLVKKVMFFSGYSSEIAYGRRLERLSMDAFYRALGFSMDAM